MAPPANIVSPGRPISYNTEAALAVNLLVKVGTLEGAVVVCGANEDGIGFTNRASDAAGDRVGVVSSGVVYAIASAAIVLGEEVKGAADGKVAKVATTGTTLQNAVGVALAAAAADTEKIPILIRFRSIRPALS